MKALTTNFLNQHYYFSTVWPYLNSRKKEKILEIVSEGKGVIPYKMIIDMQSFLKKVFGKKQNFIAQGGLRFFSHKNEDFGGF